MIHSSTESTLRYQRKYDHDAVYGRRLSKAQDQGLEFCNTWRLYWSCDISKWRTSEFRKALKETPRPASRVTLEKHWHSQQQQQHYTSGTDVPSSLKKEAESEHRAGAQDITDHFTEANLVSRNWGRLLLIWKRLLLSKRRCSDTFSQAEAVKEETTGKYRCDWKNQNWFEQNLYSWRLGEGEHGCWAKNRSKPSSRWVTWSSLNWRIPEFCAPSCLHHVFEGTIVCTCGKFIRPSQEMIQRFRTAFDILWKRNTSVHLTWLQEVKSMNPNCGKNIITKRKMRYEARERITEPTRLFGKDGKMMRLTGNPNKTLVSQMLG